MKGPAERGRSIRAMTLTSRSRRLIRLGLGLAVLSVLATSGWMWLRDSSFVAVRDVQITGVTASDGDRVRAALQNAAQEMTTLHVREQALREATASFTSVEDLRVRTDFPHGMTIEVVEREPVAALAGGRGERRIPVTSSGVLLRGVTAERDLPSLKLRQTAVGPKLTDRRALRALRIASAAPGPLLSRASELEIGSRGVVVSLEDGPELVFGSDEDAGAKWRAAARVLAETSAQGATYLDLRIPGRVAAGGLAPLTPEEENLNPQPEPENGSTLNQG
jgi:cell division protein FtsQ